MKSQANPEQVLDLCDQQWKAMPSYINLSCAVSGYRQLNKYDAPIREGIHHHDDGANHTLLTAKESFQPVSNDMNRVCNTMPHSEDLFKRQMKKWECWDSTYHNYDENSFTNNSVSGRVDSSCRKNMTNLNYYPHAELEKLNNLELGREGVQSGGLNHCPNNSAKSFIQQRIERLYGPGALGVGFRTSRALLEMRHGVDKQRNSVEGNEVTDGELPSVFKHLRPEFRCQLPVKAKPGVSFDSETKKFYQGTHPKHDNTGQFAKNVVAFDATCRKVNSERVRNIPIQMENGDHVESITVEKGQTPLVNGTKVNDISNAQRISKIINSKLCDQKSSTKKRNSVLDHNTDVELPPSVNGCQACVEPLLAQTMEAKDGNHFLKIADIEENILSEEVSKIEKDLERITDSLSEEIRGKLLSTIGKVRLLLNQKVKQFKGLCLKNLNNNLLEEFPTTNDDLAGFWDMVVIQIDSVKELINEIDILRCNDWKEVLPATIVEKVIPTKGNKDVDKKVKSSVGGSKVTKDSSRIKAQEERRKLMREAMNAKRKETSLAKMETGDQIEIFVAEKK